MTQATVTLTDFLLARIAEDEAAIRSGPAYMLEGRTMLAKSPDPDDVPVGWHWAGVEYGDDLSMEPSRALAECEAKRRIVDWHRNWPVLVEGPTTFDQSDGDGLASVTMRMSRPIAWATEQQYREKFGSEPPSGPILRMLALPYADHPDYRDEWTP